MPHWSNVILLQRFKSRHWLLINNWKRGFMLPSNMITPTQVRWCKILGRKYQTFFLSTLFVWKTHRTVSTLNCQHYISSYGKCKAAYFSIKTATSVSTQYQREKLILLQVFLRCTQSLTTARCSTVISSFIAQNLFSPLHSIAYHLFWFSPIFLPD